MLENENVEEQVVPAQGVEEEVSSPETTPQEPVETVEAPTEPVTPEEPEQQVPYDRFKEVNDAKKVAEQQNQQLLEMLQRQQPVQQPQQDKYAHLTPEEQVFYRNQDKRTAEIVSDALAKQKVEYDKEINSIKGVVYGSEAKSFLKDHPDIKKNSPEAMDILQKMQRGLTMDEAYWAVKGPAGVKVAQQTAQTKVKQQMQVKKKANTEHEGVNQVLPGKRSFREDLENENFVVD